MKTLPRFFLLVATLAAPLALSATITRNVEKTFTVQPGGNFKAQTQGGNIKIETSDRPEVHISVKQVVRASTEADARSTCHPPVCPPRRRTGDRPVGVHRSVTLPQSPCRTDFIRRVTWS